MRTAKVNNSNSGVQPIRQKTRTTNTQKIMESAAEALSSAGKLIADKIKDGVGPVIIPDPKLTKTKRSYKKRTGKEETKLESEGQTKLPLEEACNAYIVLTDHGYIGGYNSTYYSDFPNYTAVETVNFVYKCDRTLTIPAYKSLQGAMDAVVKYNRALLSKIKVVSIVSKNVTQEVAPTFGDPNDSNVNGVVEIKEFRAVKCSTAEDLLISYADKYFSVHYFNRQIMQDMELDTNPKTSKAKNAVLAKEAELVHTIIKSIKYPGETMPNYELAISEIPNNLIRYITKPVYEISKPIPSPGVYQSRFEVMLKRVSSVYTETVEKIAIDYGVPLPIVKLYNLYIQEKLRTISNIYADGLQSFQLKAIADCIIFYTFSKDYELLTSVTVEDLEFFLKSDDPNFAGVPESEYAFLSVSLLVSLIKLNCILTFEEQDGNTKIHLYKVSEPTVLKLY